MNKEKIKGLFHLIAGLIVLYHGFDSLESVNIQSAALYLGLAIMFLLIAAMHRSIARRFFAADTAFYLVESLTILYAAWHFHSINRPVSYTIHLIAGLLFLLICVISALDSDYASNKRNGRRGRRRRRRRSHPKDDIDLPAQTTS